MNWLLHVPDRSLKTVDMTSILTYADLFAHTGEGSPEVMLAARYLTGVKINANPKYIGTRLSNGYSVIVPTQTLIDTYRCTDGKRIDQSSLYNPKSPYQNRDPRLDYSIIRPGSWHNNFKFEIHPDSTKTSAIINGKLTRIGEYGSYQCLRFLYRICQP